MLMNLTALFIAYFLDCCWLFMNQPSPLLFYFCASCWCIRTIGCECGVINITGCHAARCVDCWPSGVSLWFTTLVSVYTPPFSFYFFCGMLWVNTWRMSVPSMFPVPTIRPGKYLNLRRWIRWNDLSYFCIILTIYGREIYRRTTCRGVSEVDFYFIRLFSINKETINVECWAEP